VRTCTRARVYVCVSVGVHVNVYMWGGRREQSMTKFGRQIVE